MSCAIVCSFLPSKLETVRPSVGDGDTVTRRWAVCPALLLLRILLLRILLWILLLRILLLRILPWILLLRILLWILLLRIHTCRRRRRLRHVHDARRFPYHAATKDGC